MTKRKAPQVKRHKKSLVIANLCLALGILIALAVTASYFYGQYEDNLYAQESEQRRLAFEQERAALEQQQRAEEEQAADERASLLNVPLPSFQSQDSPAPASSQPSQLGPPRRIVIPAISVNSEVVESEIKAGEWQVPKFMVGHLQGTVNPKQQGNSVYTGHIQSISAGNVFARLGDLHVGDQIYLVTTQSQYLYVVSETKVVANDDLSVVRPTPDPTVTLITCTGTWDFLKRDYLQRLVVVGKLFKDVPPGRLPFRPV